MATAVQTTINFDPAVGVAGMLYDTSSDNEVLSVIASEDIPFGSYVKIAGQYGELPDNAGEVTAGLGGVAVWDQTKAVDNLGLGLGAGYKSGDIMNVLVRGRIWVTGETTLANQSIPFVRFTANGGTQNGWRLDADAGKAVARPGIMVYKAGAANGLAVVMVNTFPAG